jgi:hypothetical protein
MNWNTESLRAGITLEVANDSMGVMGVRGTWHRVLEGSAVVLTTRNRGDALRTFQRLAFKASGA